MNKLFYILLLIIPFYSCNTELDYKISGYSQKIIVEGTIANNEYPSVYLSLNIPLSESVDTATILKNVIRTAKVTISDGENTEILTSRWDKTHFPPYVYRGYDLKGVEGKKYFLTVEYGGYTLKSETTIPYGSDIKNFKTTQLEENDSLRILSMTFNIDMSHKTAFRVFTKKSKDKYYRETPMVFNSELSFSGDKTFDISPQPMKSDSSYSENSYFAVGDTVKIRLCAIDSTSTQFFKALTLFSSSNGIGSNIFIGEKDALNSNISSPGFGIWWGGSVRNYQLIIQ
ncbi:MAG: DUF4249 domain-containing protein [Paludibacter sp.]|nr:DUF4249 domain-containing protein [Paludibacter sp.]